MEAFSKQEGGFPEFSPQEPSEAPGQEKSLKKYLYILAGVIVLAVLLFVFLSSGPPEAEYGDGVCDVLEENCIDHPNDCKCKSNEVCSPEKKRCIRQTNDSLDTSKKGNLSGAKSSSYGNGICDSLENCLDHPKDCKCSSDQYCSKEKKCVSPVCGNGICEDKKEGSDTCCSDCPCPLADCQVCNSQTHMCEMPAVQISEDFVRSAVVDYYSGRGLEAGNVTIKGDTCKGSEVYKLVEVEVVGSESTEEVLVSETGEVSRFSLL